MIRYKNCSIFRVEDRENILATVDIETTSPLNVYSSFEDDRYKEDKQMTAFTETTCNLDKTGYQITVPNMGEFKITSFLKKQINVGDFKKKYRYQLTLEG